MKSIPCHFLDYAVVPGLVGITAQKSQKLAEKEERYGGFKDIIYVVHIGGSVVFSDKADGQSADVPVEYV